MSQAETSPVLLTVTPDQAFFTPGVPATFTVSADPVGDGARITAEITYLTDHIATLEAELSAGQVVITWQPPEIAPRGYGLTVTLLDATGATLATASTAFDVLNHWLDAPRYGFLSEFDAGRAAENIDYTLDLLLRYHVNGLQFYDWQYRHEILLPPTANTTGDYTDLLGRRMSMQTVRALIDAAHARRIAAMPYTAIYGASPAFFNAHQDWGLYAAAGVPFDFGEGLLNIMDPTPGSPWADHLLDQFAQVLDQTAFDGIHLDQYGAPKTGQNAAGEQVDLAVVFPAFIDLAAQVVAEKRGDDGAMIFNAVGNWPVETVAPADQDVVYIEVWDPYREFLDLHQIIANAQMLGGGKPVIIAAYIHPNTAHNVRLADAVIFASGAYHLELGEPNAMLADPYFPSFGEMKPELQAVMQRYYDFLVRYENILAIDTTDATPRRAAALTIADVETGNDRSRNCVAVIVRMGAESETFSLINFMGLRHGKWNEAHFAGPEALTDLPVTLATDRSVVRVWIASPDGADIAPQMVDFVQTNGAISFTVPSLDYWTLITVEYGS
ncbi:MAG: hypothetical protein JXA10_08635 [Anaerolineae bacterium]|nr:hypothetical protein [Anaerolineae bacterium]